MGLFTKALTILILAVSTPLLYREFANDGTIKFMSSYYSNYKSIDAFLRQSASHIDKAQEFLPSSQQIKITISSLSQKIDDFKRSLKDSDPPPESPKKEKKSDEKSKTTEKRESQAKKSDIRYSSCPGEDLQGQKVRLWTKEELAIFDGSSNNPEIYLGFLGLVYNVTAAAQHYSTGSEYNAFAGRDATRAFVTGNFTHDLNDDIKDLEESMYTHIGSWASFYGSHYPIAGRLIGAFFDSTGCATKELDRVYRVFENLERSKEAASDQESKFPECNSEWNADLNKGRVWCSEKSGGIERDWVGFPRVYDDGITTRCACFNPKGPGADEVAKKMTLYPGCDPSATECSLKQ